MKQTQIGMLDKMNLTASVIRSFPYCGRVPECERAGIMYIDLLILMQIDHTPKHGYEIKKNIQKELGHLLDVNHNLLYPALRRFTEEGCIFKKVNEQDGKPNQYIYEITELGKRKIEELINAFSEKDAKHDVEFLVRVSLFHRISKENRLRILAMRKEHLETLQENAKHRLERSAQEQSMFLKEVYQFSAASIEQEIEWIDHLRDRIKDHEAL